VIRDVAASYRRAIAETVHHYSGWRPTPALIDSLKGEGCWNNDWEASHELLRRWRRDLPTSTHAPPMPPFEGLVEMFSSFYFGGDPNGDSQHWHGFIRSEPLLVAPSFFDQLGADGIAWGFVSGAEPPSARYVLEQRLGLVDPPLIAMGEAPDKPDPSGFLQLAGQILAGWPGGGPGPRAWGPARGLSGRHRGGCANRATGSAGVPRSELSEPGGGAAPSPGSRAAAQSQSL